MRRGPKGGYSRYSHVARGRVRYPPAKRRLTISRGELTPKFKFKWHSRETRAFRPALSPARDLRVPEFMLELRRNCRGNSGKRSPGCEPLIVPGVGVGWPGEARWDDREWKNSRFASRRFRSAGRFSLVLPSDDGQFRAVEETMLSALVFFRGREKGNPFPKGSRYGERCGSRGIMT